MRLIKPHLAASATSLLMLAVLTGCASGGGSPLQTFASKCGETAYDATFYGGSEYDYTERSTVSLILKSEAEGYGEISDQAMQRIVNQVGREASVYVANEFAECMDDAPVVAATPAS